MWMYCTLPPWANWCQECFQALILSFCCHDVLPTHILSRVVLNGGAAAGLRTFLKRKAGALPQSCTMSHDHDILAQECAIVDWPFRVINAAFDASSPDFKEKKSYLCSPARTCVLHRGIERYFCNCGFASRGLTNTAQCRWILCGILNWWMESYQSWKGREGPRALIFNSVSNSGPKELLWQDQRITKEISATTWLNPTSKKTIHYMMSCNIYTEFPRWGVVVTAFGIHLWRIIVPLHLSVARFSTEEDAMIDVLRINWITFSSRCCCQDHCSNRQARMMNGTLRSLSSVVWWKTWDWHWAITGSRPKRRLRSKLAMRKEIQRADVHPEGRKNQPYRGLLFAENIVTVESATSSLGHAPFWRRC